MPKFYELPSDSESDVLKGIRYHENLPKKERDELSLQIRKIINAKSQFYPDSLTGIASLPDYLQRRIDEEDAQEKMNKVFDDDNDFDFPEDDDCSEEFEEDKDNSFDPTPDLGIIFD